MNASFPGPTRDLPPGRLDQRAEHLRAEIRRLEQTAHLLYARRLGPRLIAAVVVAAAVATPAFALRSQIVDLFTTAHPVIRPATASALPAGWRQFTEMPHLLTPKGAAVETIITSWHWRIGSGLGPGDAIPANGIMIGIELLRAPAGDAKVNLCRTAPRLRGYPARPLPLRLPTTTTAIFEGAPSIHEYRVFGRYDDSYNYEVRVDINDPHPSKQTLSRTQRIVSSISFPDWPTPTTC